MSAIRVLIGDIPPLLESMLAEMVQTERDMVLFDPMAPNPRSGETEGINIVRMSTDRYHSVTTMVSDVAQFSAYDLRALDRTASQIVIIHSERRDGRNVRVVRDHADG